MVNNTCQPTEEEFAKLAAEFNLLTVHKTVNADMETPVSVFMKLAHPDYSFLLESAEGGERYGRYSFIGCEPLEVIGYKAGRMIGINGEGDTGEATNPVDFLFSKMAGFRVCEDGPELPFRGGAVGYLSYDLLPYIEDIQLNSNSGLGVPDMMFMLSKTSAAFDHLLGRLTLMANVFIPEGSDPSTLRRLYKTAVSSIDGMISALSAGISSDFSRDLYHLPREMDFDGVSSNRGLEEFQDMVIAAKEHIFAGDVFQVVPSQRFSLPLRCPAFSIYRSLRSENPSPYMFYLNFGDLALIGSSPEPLVKKSGGKAIIRPIAGTRRRGATEQEDRALEEELLADVKERAEHLMLVDLARNDLGRICNPGTVKVTRMMEIERFSEVMHIVSEVEGELRADCDNRDVLRSSFPAGTVSGAPKIRACQIIDELESEKRGPYAGAAGYISYNGDMDTCIAIRTIVCHGGKAYVQAGAGVVADSDPAMEYEETRNKARALIRAIRLSEAREGVV
ncbi:MAG: anthranilate synthase component I [Candidatus Solincola sediminis]|uniref:Anthranilate synthase component 1 n=1 Tax=Candidatus Solincola sediminis TaxID=1797199 RepID=A0A1F2WK50_9ACTN|nr:MAG: anthranilate synthase component I [Candidatus Solincola sediminis]